MKGLIGAAAAALLLAGCVAVPVAGPYHDTHYYPAPAVGVGVYAAPAYRYHHRHHYHHHHRHHGWRGHH